MKINWKVRFKNKIWLSSFFSAIIATVYTLLDLFHVIPEVDEITLLRIIDALLVILSLLGVIIDPTTTGVYDSERAQGYTVPWDDNLEEGGNG